MRHAVGFGLHLSFPGEVFVVKCLLKKFIENDLTVDGR